MANDAVEDPQAEQPAELPLSDVGLIGALARLLDEQMVKKVIKPRIDAPKVPLLKAYKGGQSELVVQIAGDIIGRYKVNLAQPKIVIDEDNEEALNKYADKHGGTKVVIQRDETWEKALLQFAEYDEDTGLIIDTRTGEVVPGLKYEQGGQPTGSLTWTWEKRDVGKKRLTRHYQEGSLNYLLTEAPELMAGPRPTAEDAQH
ncbi:hypothetical protein [Streptomyces cahuitamycinicus]|uniref:Uncharacterized protein n=1 Tax=Streptomyces cahuitamycinicus TaxID=2070367 RepID=A0A2N8THT6_9ACTN|nr:hypothetical protein [Streptomyces cahuitamycinicus]PNG18592.1 hypothetical protein C1J00_30265 [Streptomyces cahuitamycinicus]